jgi:hydrogenase-4 membrane subunit HyfE
MELPSSGYFYALAALSMAFVGFTAIVVVLRQGTGKSLSSLHILFTKLFVELGLMATAFAMLAPTLSLCGISEDLVWRISSAIMLAVLVPWLVTYPMRRLAAAPKVRLPLRWYIMTTVGTVVVIALSLNAFGILIHPGPGPLAIATIFVLSYASVAFIGTYSTFLWD